MAVTDRDSLEGELVVTGQPKSLSWGKPADFIALLVRILRVQFPVNQGVDFIVQGFKTPGVDDRHRMWARRDKNGNPDGWWSFIKGRQRKVYDVAPGEVRWFNGHSSSPPDGWQVITPEAGGMDAAVVASYVSQYVTDGADGYIKFAARYIGYS